MDKKTIATTEILENVVNKSSADKISVNDLINAMNSGGFGLVMLLFSLPILIPFPPPIPSFIAIPLMIFSLQMIVGHRAPKLPKVISNIKIKRSHLAKAVEKSVRNLRKLEKLLKPRLLFLTKGVFERILGLFILIFSISVLIPLPFTNLIPGIGILVTSFGLLGKDGLIILLGIFIGIFGIFATIIFYLVGIEVVHAMKDFVMSIYN